MRKVDGHRLMYQFRSLPKTLNAIVSRPVASDKLDAAAPQFDAVWPSLRGGKVRDLVIPRIPPLSEGAPGIAELARAVVAGNPAPSAQEYIPEIQQKVVQVTPDGVVTGVNLGVPMQGSMQVSPVIDWTTGSTLLVAQDGNRVFLLPDKSGAMQVVTIESPNEKSDRTSKTPPRPVIQPKTRCVSPVRSKDPADLRLSDKEGEDAENAANLSTSPQTAAQGQPPCTEAGNVPRPASGHDDSSVTCHRSCPVAASSVQADSYFEKRARDASDADTYPRPSRPGIECRISRSDGSDDVCLDGRGRRIVKSSNVWVMVAYRLWSVTGVGNLVR